MGLCGNPILSVNKIETLSKVNLKFYQFHETSIGYKNPKQNIHSHSYQVCCSVVQTFEASFQSCQVIKAQKTLSIGQVSEVVLE